MSTQTENTFFTDRSQALIRGTDAGLGRPIVLMHGLTATRHYVVMGSRLLERSGYRVISYDARGHGESGRAPASEAYSYEDLASDLRAVLDELAVERATLCGNSMGAHAAMSFALSDPGRVEALVQITPAYAGRLPSRDELAHWDALARGVAEGGVEGFMEAYHPSVDPRFADTVQRFTRQRLERHADPYALADPLRVVPRSQPFAALDSLQDVEVPVLVVASRDEADPSHPLHVAEAYAAHLPRSELVVEEQGKSPLAWQGAQLSRAIADFLDRCT